MQIQDNYIRHVYAIEEITDGDTITAIVELGYNNLGRVTFRFKGINTAEKRSKKGTKRYKLAMDAIDFITNILKTYRVRVFSEKFEKGGFGRYLGTLYYEKDGQWVNLNEEMLNLGIAQEYFKGASKDLGEW